MKLNNCCKFPCRENRTRTCDPSIPNAVFSLLNYFPISCAKIYIFFHNSKFSKNFFLATAWLNCKFITLLATHSLETLYLSYKLFPHSYCFGCLTGFEPAKYKCHKLAPSSTRPQTPCWGVMSDLNQHPPGSQPGTLPLS